MYRDIFTNKWILGGVGFLIVLSVGCVLWYQHDIAPYRREAAETEAFARQWEKDRQAQQKRSTETQETSTDTPAESNITQNAEKPITDTTQANETTNTDNSVIAGTTEPVRMSPHGFGAYPEIPEGAPIAPFEEGDSIEMELLQRVMVKKWNEGERFVGGIIEDGLVYLTYRNVVYVEYDYITNPFTGEKTRYVSGTMGGGMPPSPADISDGNISTDRKIIELSKAGLDPYEVLSLPKFKYKN